MSPHISPYEDGGAGALPTVVIVHGGFFKDKWSARNTQTASLVPFLPGGTYVTGGGRDGRT